VSTANGTTRLYPDGRNSDLAAQLALQAGDVEPRALAADPAAGEVEYVQETHGHGAPAALEAEHLADRRPVQDRLVDDVPLAVPAPDGFEPLDPQRGEQRPVVGGDLLAAVQLPAGPPRAAPEGLISSAGRATIARWGGRRMPARR
jgi:hypothetical protein